MIGIARALLAGEEVPHTGLQRRDPAGADAGDGADLDERGRDRLSEASYQPRPAHSPFFPRTGSFSKRPQKLKIKLLMERII